VVVWAAFPSWGLGLGSLDPTLGGGRGREEGPGAQGRRIPDPTLGWGEKERGHAPGARIKPYTWVKGKGGEAERPAP
jgi:hypothetical protein